MERKRIVVASQNPVKITAALLGFQSMFPEEAFEVTGVSVSSGVADQPSSDAETLQGALNRVKSAFVAVPQADFWIGIEGGIEDKGQEMEAFAWVVVQSVSQIGKGKSGTFSLPSRVANLVKAGMELGEADDLVFGMTNSKQEHGAVGILTGNVITRTELYKTATVLSLIPFRNSELFHAEPF